MCTNENLIIWCLFKAPISGHFMLSIQEVWHIMITLLSYLFCIKAMTWEYVFPITLSPLTFIILSPGEGKVITEISLSRCFLNIFYFVILYLTIIKNTYMLNSRLVFRKNKKLFLQIFCYTFLIKSFIYSHKFSNILCRAIFSLWWETCSFWPNDH